MEPIVPSKLFTDFVSSAIKSALNNQVHSGDMLMRRLWGAASYDAYIISYVDKPLLDSSGVATGIADNYACLIRLALQEYSERQILADTSDRQHRG